MDGIIGVDILKTTKELVGKHQHCFEKELATAKVEGVFQTWSEKIEHQGIVFAFAYIGVNSWNAVPPQRGID